MTDNFLTENCGFSTFRVRALYNEAKKLTKPALVDALKHGVNSEYGFEAMFKLEEALPTVKAVLDDIYNYKGKPSLKPHPSQRSSPLLSCVTEKSAKIYDYLKLDYDPWSKCQMGGSDSTPLQAFYAEGTAYIFLCPTLFVQPTMTTKNNCPSLEKNMFSGDVGSFYQNYQTYTLLYHLIRFYLGHNALDETTNPKEQLDWNRCVSLSLVDSVLNPTNLQIYIACKQIQFIFPKATSFHALIRMNAVVSQKCTNWPDPFAPPFRKWLPSNLTSDRLSTLVNIS